MICSQGRTYAKIIWQPQPPTHAQHSLIVGTHYDTDFIIIIDPPHRKTTTNHGLLSRPWTNLLPKRVENGECVLCFLF